MTLKWTAQRVLMGGWVNVSNLFEAQREKEKVKCHK